VALEKSSIIPKLRIFISWSGKQAGLIGHAFHSFLPDVVNGIEPFVSSEDIDQGTRWNNVLSRNLQESSCAIVCLTPESLKSTWVAFETGAISKATGTPETAHSRIWTYLVSVEYKDLQLSPFAEFQPTAAVEEQTWKLIRSINDISPDPVSAETLKRRFDSIFWPEFSKKLEQAKSASDELGASEVLPAAFHNDDVLLEILKTVRSLQRDYHCQKAVPMEVAGGRELAIREAILNLVAAEFRHRGRVVPPNLKVATTEDGRISLYLEGQGLLGELMLESFRLSDASRIVDDVLKHFGVFFLSEETPAVEEGNGAPPELSESE
jgi:hypothetical protein